jgi:hypothetical protein
MVIVRVMLLAVLFTVLVVFSTTDWEVEQPALFKK